MTNPLQKRYVLDSVKRNTIYDSLRFFGISCIILAHMSAPKLIFQIRNFDVPLMVLISGISFAQFSSNSYSSYGKYLYSRFTRLILPTWLFLIFYNAADFIAGNELPGVKNLALQFSLIGGSNIGLWIIRIFFSMALITPFLYRLNDKFKKERTFYIFIISTYLLYEISFYFSKLVLEKQALTVLNIVVYFTVTYGLILLYGLRITSLEKTTLRKHMIIIGSAFAFCLVILFFEYDKFVATQIFKYPPRLYYLSYALFISISLYYLFRYKNITITNYKLIQFIGRSTLWIYLWHWFIIKVYHYIKIDTNFIIKYFLIYSVTVILVYLQTKLIFFLTDKLHVNKNKKQFIIKVFTG